MIHYEKEQLYMSGIFRVKKQKMQMASKQMQIQTHAFVLCKDLL